MPSSNATWKTHLICERRSHGGTLVFKATADTGQRVAAKLYQSRERALAEHVSAQTLLRRGARVARPLLLDPSHGLYVSEWIEGASLEEALFTEQRQTALTAAGMWLREFHRPSWRWPRPHHPARARARLRAGSGILRDQPEQKRAFETAVAAHLQRIANADPSFYRPVLLHGDFVPGNLLLPKEGPVTIDVASSHKGPAGRDLATMTVRLAMLAADDPAGPAFNAKEARDTLLAAYGLTDRRALHWLGLYEEANLLWQWRRFANMSYWRPATRDYKVRLTRRLLAEWPLRS